MGPFSCKLSLCALNYLEIAVSIKNIEAKKFNILYGIGFTLL